MPSSISIWWPSWGRLPSLTVLTASGACSAKRSAQAKVRTVVRHYPVLLKRGRTWRSKRTIVKALSTLRGFGPYTTSVFWQYYRLAVRYPANADLTFAACGPGCRSGINWLFGHPPDLCKEARGPSIEPFFSSRLELLLPYFRCCAFLKDSPSDCADIRSIKNDLRRHRVRLRLL